MVARIHILFHFIFTCFICIFLEVVLFEGRWDPSVGNESEAKILSRKSCWEKLRGKKVSAGKIAFNEKKLRGIRNLSVIFEGCPAGNQALKIGCPDCFLVAPGKGTGPMLSPACNRLGMLIPNNKCDGIGKFPPELDKTYE